MTDYLELTPTDTDTIVSEILIEENGKLKTAKKIWYNDSLVFDELTGLGSQSIVIVK